jgi:broad specificity phosphatase PhoE
MEEVDRVIEALADNGLTPRTVYHSPVPQARETAELFLKSTEVSIIEDQRLRPLDLGVLAGLSRNEAKSKFPGPARAMEEWREGRIELHKLVIPDAEDYRAFYQRGQRFLGSVDPNEGNTLVVGTRSILILLLSILLNRTIEPGGGYREIPIQNSWFFVFEYTPDGYVLVPQVSHYGAELGKDLSYNGRTRGNSNR